MILKRRRGHDRRTDTESGAAGPDGSERPEQGTDVGASHGTGLIASHRTGLMTRRREGREPRRRRVWSRILGRRLFRRRARTRGAAGERGTTPRHSETAAEQALAPKKIIEVAGEQVHVVESGRADGPPLVLSTGLGGAWFDWQPTVRLLNARYRVICFDRPGLGLSPVGSVAPSLRAEVRLLAALAEWAGAPVTIVAHSVAGFHAEAVARIHPGLVSGMVLVDPSCEGANRSGVRVSAAVIPLIRLLGLLFRITGIARLIGPLARRVLVPLISRRGDTASHHMIRSVYGRGDVLGTAIAENSAYREMAADLAALRERQPFPPIPLVVLTALGDIRKAKKRRRWSECHRKLAEMSPRGRQVDLPDGLHMLQLDEPEAIADAVDEVTG